MADSGPVSVPVNASAEFSFSCHHSRGAALWAQTQALLYVADYPGEFEEYILDLVQSGALERVARLKQRGIALSDIIIVTGCYRTSSGAIMVVNESASSTSTSFKAGASGVSVQGSQSSQTRIPLHVWGAPSDCLAIGNPGPGNDGVYRGIRRSDGTPDWTQCIFLEGWRVQRRRLRGMKIKAAAGPHELPMDRPRSPTPPPISADDDDATELIILNETFEDPREVRSHSSTICSRT